MIVLHEIQAAGSDPEALEAIYQRARQTKAEQEFREAVQACYEKMPENLLYAAWDVRLREAEQERERAVNWALAVPLSLILGVLFWALTAPALDLSQGMPYLILAWSAVATGFVNAFLAATSRQNVRRAVWTSAALLVVLAYVTAFVATREREHYQLLMALHLPLLAWIACGLYVLGIRSGHRERFAFVVKSVEVFVTAGLFVGAGGVFAGVTIGMFEVLGLSLPEPVLRLLFAGGAGLIPVLAVAISYDPRLSPIAQQARQGLSRMLSIVLRLLLPLALLVLLIYLAAIPFRFMEPFHNRQTLIVYNGMLFAVIGLLVGATPAQETDLQENQQRLLRAGMLAVAVLATLVSLYALSATLYRTITMGGWTVNRLAVIGWNTINVGLLVWLVIQQLQAGVEGWLDAAQTVFGWGMRAYAAWATFLALAVPLLFGER